VVSFSLKKRNGHPRSRDICERHACLSARRTATLSTQFRRCPYDVLLSREKRGNSSSSVGKQWRYSKIMLFPTPVFYIWPKAVSHPCLSATRSPWHGNWLGSSRYQPFHPRQIMRSAIDVTTHLG
jgi:hypothetical protein